MKEITEIEIEDVGTYRLPNMYQSARIKHMAAGANKGIAALAFGLGMTIPQFKKLPIEKQREVLAAYHQLTAPPIVQRRDAPPRPPRPWERVSQERMIELGRELIDIKRQLPRGHFGPWIREKSGLSVHVVHRYMRLAREADQQERSAA